MENLIRYKKYSRKDIHDIFSPDTQFYKGAGSWGAHGMIRVPNTLHDYIFLVTYGRKIAGHEFDEKIDSNGVLTWQSKPSEGLTDDRVIDYINHDYKKNNIYLFLRTNGSDDYSYMGKLAYVSHDNEREYPVYFKWQILDWNSKDVIDKVDSDLVEIEIDDEINSEDFILSLNTNKIEYKNNSRKGKNTSEFNHKSYDFLGEAKKNTSIGNLGEDIIVLYEKEFLISNGRKDLADKVMATRNFAGNAESFDILSYELNGEKKYIEVKTTTGSINNEFYLSEKEVEFSEEFSNNYYLYRIYDLDKKNKTANFYIRKGSFLREKLIPTNYVCRLGDNNEKIQ